MNKIEALETILNSHEFFDDLLNNNPKLNKAFTIIMEEYLNLLKEKNEVISNSYSNLELERLGVIDTSYFNS